MAPTHGKLLACFYTFVFTQHKILRSLKGKPQRPPKANGKKISEIRIWIKTDLLDVAVELLLAAAGPVVAVEGGLDQRCHDAPHAGLIGAAVALAVVLHA